MKLRTPLLGLALVLFSAGLVPAQTVTDDVATSLEQQFRPDAVPRMLELIANTDMLSEFARSMQFHALDSPDGFFTGPTGYRELHFPGDRNTYVLLYWNLRLGGLYWRLVGASDGKSFHLVQDPGVFLEINIGDPVGVVSVDVDRDGIPEVLIQEGVPGGVQALYVYRWSAGQLTLISPLDTKNVPPLHHGIPPDINTALKTLNSDITIEDVDGDGKAEIVVHPAMVRHGTVVLPSGGIDEPWDVLTPYRIYHLENGVYTLWKEVPADQPFPVSVPGIAAIQPGTLPLSELNKSQGGGDLRVFVSRPAGTTYSADDFVQTSFVFDVANATLGFKKLWDNQDYPDLTLGNSQWQGVAVRKDTRASQGDWNVNPSKPAYPSPDLSYQFDFLGPYLELSLSRAAVFPFIKDQATRLLAANPQLDRVFIEVPISGKMKDGKLAAIGAIVCVTKTGSGK
jgi:hypothetical protein